MKAFFTLILLLNISFECFSQNVVYFDFVTHNEETAQWNGTPYYTMNRSRLVSLADYFQTNGITWNMQSDWVYLTNVLTKETPALTSLTNNKNILRWMHEDKGVEMDPHAHESQYIYPDVAYLMDSIGLPESKLIGGTIYNDSNGINIWTNLINGQNGIIFPNKFWQPDYMMGGGTPNHVADLKYYGCWNPQSTTSYLTNDTNNHLRHLGVGCEIKIKTTSTVSDIVAQINDVVANIQNGNYPVSGFYLQSIFFEQGDLNNPAFYNMVKQVADSVNLIVNAGLAEWKTLKQAYTIWETTFNAQAFQWECGQLVTGLNEHLAVFNNTPYPNPFMDYIKLPKLSGNEFRIVSNLQGQLVWSGNNIEVENFSAIQDGIYFLQVTDQKSVTTFKLLKN